MSAGAQQDARSTDMQQAVRGGELVPVYVWDAMVRILHWTIVLSILILVVTGVYIGNPFITAPGEASEHFIMGKMKVVHFGAAIFFTLAVLSRVLWAFLTKVKYARWHQFVPAHKKRRRDLLKVLKFYLFFSRRAPHFIGHNPLAGATYGIVFLCFAALILTGLGMFAMDHPDSPVAFFRVFLGLFGGPLMARFIHHLLMWLILGFAVHHLAAAMHWSITEGDGLLGSIFSGFKWVPKHTLEEDQEEYP